MSGPLSGVKVLELAGIGPGPFCCMMLADMGADVIRVDRTEPADLGTPTDPKFQFLNRGRRSIAIDLKTPSGVGLVKRLAANSDILIEGFRPGVTERLGLGPDDCWAANPALVYGRMTGWGQSGPLAQAVGHDINYIAITGALDAIGQAGGPPVPPLNLVGDFGGGATFLAFGVACALIEARRSGKGQVVDAAIVDGTAYLMTSIFGTIARGAWQKERGTNMLAGGAPWYGVYATKDGKYVSVGAIEARFYRDLLARLNIDPDSIPKQHDRTGWPVIRARFEDIFRTKTRDEWTTLFAGSNACFAPVLDLDETTTHSHMTAREIFTQVSGLTQPAPAPRFSRTSPTIRCAPPTPGQDTDEVLKELGLSSNEVGELKAQGAFG